MDNLLNWDVTIPWYVLNDPNLSQSEIIIYAYIRGLTRQKGFCWATNAYLGECARRKISTGTKAVRTLKECGYIICLFKKTNKDETIRRIYLNEEKNQNNIEQAIKEGWIESEKKLRPPSKKLLAPPSKKLLPNKRINNIKNKEVSKDTLYDSKESLGTRIKRKQSKASLVRQKAKEVPKEKIINKPLFLSKKIKSCIEYWNSKSILSNTLVNPDKPTKQLKKTKEVLNKFFAGDLFTSPNTVMPGYISDSDLADLVDCNALDDLFNMIDTWEYILTSGIYKINIDYMRKLSFVQFLQGDSFVRNKNGGIVAPIVSHVFFEPDLIVEDQWPKTTKVIRKNWERIFGKTKETNKEFIKISSENLEYMKQHKMRSSIMNGPWFHNLLVEVSQRRN